MSIKKIEITPYDLKWPAHFNQEAKKIRRALGKEFEAIHHVGSTAIPDLHSKPIIDMVAEVRNLAFDHQGLVDLGYTYRGGFNLPLRKSFLYGCGGLSVHLHVFEKDDPEVELNLRFRDHLMAHPGDRDEYTKLKYQLLGDEKSHIKRGMMFKGYTLGKQSFIHDILRKTGINRLRFVICSHSSEWKVARKLRSQYFLKLNIPINTDEATFSHQDHKHFILYKGIDIIGYAHVQIIPGQRTLLKMIVIDEKYKNKDYDTELLKFIEKWLKLESHRSIQYESFQNK